MFRQDKFDVELMLIRAAALTKDIGLYSEFSGIVVDGFYTDVEEVDVFIREWKGNVANIKKFCVDNRRILHASRLRVRLADASDVKENLDGEDSSFRTRPNSSHYVDYKPKLTDFVANHTAFVPSESSLPRSYQVWRRSIDSEHVRKSIFNRPRSSRCIKSSIVDCYFNVCIAAPSPIAGDP